MPDAVEEFCSRLPIDTRGFQLCIDRHLVVILSECHPVTSLRGVVQNCSNREYADSPPCPIFRIKL